MTRSRNQPGGPGEGFTAQLRDTLKAYGYTRAAGRVGLTGGQQRNFHYGLIDDPFSLGRGVYSWTWNAPAAALEAASIDPCSRKGQHVLEATSSGIMHDTDQMAMLLSRCDPQEASPAITIVAAWTRQAEVAEILTKMADAVASGIYFIKVTAGVQRATTKITLVK